MSNPSDRTLREIGRRLKICRPLAVLDLETTGVSATLDRVIEIAVAIVHPDGRVTRWSRLVHPGRSIPGEATRVHGIGDEHVRDQPPFEAIALELAELLRQCDFAGFNVERFDLQILQAELDRAGIPVDLSKAHVLDAMSIYHRNERRDLEAAMRFYCDRDHDGHRAAVDIDAAIEVLAAQLTRYPHLPDDLASLAAYCRGGGPDWVSSDGKIVWRDGRACLTFGKHAGKSLERLASEEESYLRWAIGQSFPADFKRIVEGALAGVFPDAAGLSSD